MKIPFLGRKKKEDEDELLDQKEQDKPKRRRRKKEEPPKPWGRSERFLVFGVLLVTILSSGFLALSAREWKLPGLPRLGLPKGVLEQTYVFEGRPPAKDTSAILKEFNALTKDASGVYGLYVINLNTDESYGVEENEVFQAASLIKLPVMTAMYAEYEAGNIDLDAVYVLKNEDKIGGSGSIIYQPAGTEYTYRQLVNLMGQQSDNTAFNIIVSTLGRDHVQGYIAEIGMTKTSLLKNETTPRDIGIFYKKLWDGKLIEKKHRDEILKALTNTIYETLIPAAIPDTRVAHKYGSEVHVLNDAGIVFGSHPYVLVIMSKGIVESEARTLIPQLAGAVHLFEEGAD